MYIFYILVYIVHIVHLQNGDEIFFQGRIFSIMLCFLTLFAHRLFFFFLNSLQSALLGEKRKKKTLQPCHHHAVIDKLPPMIDYLLLTLVTSRKYSHHQCKRFAGVNIQPTIK